MEKTNVMRILDSKKLDYVAHQFDCAEAVSGVEAARRMGIAPERVYKTLVTVGKTGQHYVFVIPVEAELDLKRAAQAVSEKSVEMIKTKELLPLTGYIHGGCSPIGMKKAFPTRVDASAEKLESMVFSAGKIGYQVEMPLATLRKAVRLELAALTCPEND